ncbi:hypothetical protein HID58_035587 [Brassica napus]|uniref:BHLH domain-containing protein n=2 Tax=Brassica TaxID=3705 RepID=A0ABQ8C5D1_BRANA|nr:hypothetical protein HID58_035587 [Brassica napus]
MHALGHTFFPNFGRESTGVYESYNIVRDNHNNGTFLDFPVPNMYGVVHHQTSLVDSVSSEVNGIDSNSVVMKKLNHNANERNRRKKINSLFTSLRSCLPDLDELKKLSIPKTVSRSVQYITELKKQANKLRQKKDDLLVRVLVQKERYVQPQPKVIAGYVSTVFATKLRDNEVMVQISSSKIHNFFIYNVLCGLEEDGFLIVDVSFLSSQGERIFYTLHLQLDTFDNYKLICEELSQRILYLYEKCGYSAMNSTLQGLEPKSNKKKLIHLIDSLSHRWREEVEKGKDVRKAGELLGVNLVSLDEKTMLIQGPIGNSETQQFQISAEGRVNLWAKLIRCYQKQHPLQAHGLSCCHTLQRPDQDCGAVGADTNRKFQVSKLRTAYDNQQMLLALMLAMFVSDIMGQVSRINTVFNDENQSIQRVKPQLCIAHSVFDKVVTHLDEKLTLLGWLFFNAIFGTHFYFDHETLVSQCFLKVLCGAEGYYSSTPSTYGGAKKIETVTLAEMNTYVLNSQPHHSYGSITKLTNLSAAQDAGVEVKQQTNLLQCLKDISFMVSCIYDNHQRLPVANFAINAGADHPEDDMHAAVNLSVEHNPVVKTDAAEKTIMSECAPNIIGVNGGSEPVTSQTESSREELIGEEHDPSSKKLHTSDDVEDRTL